VEQTTERIRQVLIDRFRPSHLELRDDSDKHVGHPGAASGGGHYSVLIVAEEFHGHSPVERHRLVYEALGSMVGAEIHALGLKTLTPAEWSASRI
jgi:BolA protein